MPNIDLIPGRRYVMPDFYEYEWTYIGYDTLCCIDIFPQVFARFNIGNYEYPFDTETWDRKVNEMKLGDGFEHLSLYLVMLCRLQPLVAFIR